MCNYINPKTNKKCKYKKSQQWCGYHNPSLWHKNKKILEDPSLPSVLPFEKGNKTSLLTSLSNSEGVASNFSKGSSNFKSGYKEGLATEGSTEGNKSFEEIASESLLKIANQKLDNALDEFTRKLNALIIQLSESSLNNKLKNPYSHTISSYLKSKKSSENLLHSFERENTDKFNYGSPLFKSIGISTNFSTLSPFNLSPSKDLLPSSNVPTPPELENNNKNILSPFSKGLSKNYKSNKINNNTSNIPRYTQK